MKEALACCNGLLGLMGSVGAVKFHRVLLVVGTTPPPPWLM